MDYQKFLERLPNLYEHWEQEGVKPKTDKFKKVLDRVRGRTTENVMQLLNFAVECLEAGEIYCQVGCCQGATLIGAMLDRSDCIAYGIDNFSVADDVKQNLAHLTANLTSFELQNQVKLYDRDFEEVFLDWREGKPNNRIGVYFYDGAHNYRSQLLNLLLIRPVLANQALIVINDSNWRTVQQATWDFAAAFPECKIELELLTPKNGYPTFWNGLQVLSWDSDRRQNHPSSTFGEKRSEKAIAAINHLQLLEQREQALDNLYSEALALQQKQKFTLAEKKYIDFLLWRRDNTQAWLNLGKIYYELENYKEAQNAILKALEIEPGNAFAYYKLGLAFEKDRNLNQAKIAYKEAIRFDPSLQEIWDVRILDNEE
jgi:protein O-GlcNAc transferase